MNYIIKAWAIFFVGFSVEILIHYWIRINTDIEIREYELHWFVIQWILALIAIAVIIKGSSSIHPLFKRLTHIGINIGLAFVLYLIMGFWYVFGSGLSI